MTGPSPRATAKWLGLAYTAAVAVFLLFGADGADVLLWNVIFLPWLVAPAALAALGVRSSRRPRAACAFLSLEAMVIVSTAAAWFYLIEVAPDAQNGIAMAFTLPALQYGAVGAFFVLARFARWNAGTAAVKG